MKRFAILLGVIAFSSAMAEETPLEIQSSTGSKYFVVEKGGTSSQPVLVLKRVRRSGTTSYSRKLYDCEARTTRELGSAESLSELSNTSRGGDMMPVEEGTVAYQLWTYACGQEVK